MRVAGIIVTVLGGVLLLISIKLALTEYDLSSSYDQGRSLGSFAFAVLVLAAGISLWSSDRTTKEGTTSAIATAQDTERQIRMVIRIFQYIGWPFSIVCGLNTVIAVGLSVPLLTTGKSEDLMAVVVASVLFGALTTFFATFIWVARKMRARSPKARGPAIALSALMLLGFPLFTIVGVICLTKIASKYAAYCDSAQVGSA